MPLVAGRTSELQANGSPQLIATNGTCDVENSSEWFWGISEASGTQPDALHSVPADKSREDTIKSFNLTSTEFLWVRSGNGSTFKVTAQTLAP